MPPLEKMDRHQTAVLWPSIGFDEYGQPDVGDPIQIIVRWNTRRMETVDAKGNTIALDALVIVDRQIAIGSDMWLGALADWYGTGSAGNDDEVMQVKTYEETLDIKGRSARHIVGLMYKGDQPNR